MYANDLENIKLQEGFTTEEVQINVFVWSNIHIMYHYYSFKKNSAFFISPLLSQIH